MVNQTGIAASLPSDQGDRERIEKDLDTTFLVEAGAGSGKTTALVKRMIALVSTGKANVENIAAITFTKKAADELKGRFRMALEKALKQGKGPAEASRLQSALENVNQCFIGTIHSFCGGLLRERPIEAGLDPGVRELEEEEAILLRNQCWDEYLETLSTEGRDQELRELISLDVGVDDLRLVYERVYLYEDVHIAWQETEQPDVFLLQHSLLPLLDEALPYIPTNRPDRDWDTLQKTIKNALRHIQLYGWSDPVQVLRLAHMFERNLKVTQNRWTDKKTAKELDGRFKDWQIYTLKPLLTSWREFIHSKLIRFVVPAVEYCTNRRAAMGLLNFQDLLVKATSLLREHEDIRNYFAQRYTRLFVDEFQDTDPVQAEMMFLLTGSNPAENNWRCMVPRAGSLFIVGDPKQSIYRFRRADISTYNFVKKRVRESGGDVLFLTSNFRSVHAIGQFVNAEFISKFPLEENEHQAAFVPMATQKSNPKGKAMSGIYTMTYPKIEGGKAFIAEADADRIAQFIAWACRSNLKIETDGSIRDAAPEDFLILHRNREFLGLYAEKLEQYGIPSESSGSSVSFQELRSLWLLASCLGDPSDKVSLLAVLRGMLFGVSDNSLYHYKVEGHPFSFYTLPDEQNVSSTARPVFNALLQLKRYSHWVRTLPALSAFSAIVDDLGIMVLAASSSSGVIRSGTLNKLMEMIQRDIHLASSWQQLTAYLDNLNQKGLEGTGLFAGSGGAVRIMNLHKSKGLEAPIVLLACPCGYSDHDASEYIDRMSDPAAGYFSVTRKRGYTQEVIAHPVGWERMAEKEREFMNAEHNRLLYVAATRAKQLMIVSQYADRPAIDPWSGLSGSLQSVTELDIQPVEPIRKTVVDIPNKFQQMMDERDIFIEEATVPSYELLSVTSQVKTSSEIVLPRPAEGRGMVFGSVVHHCIELLGMNRELWEGRLEELVHLAAVEFELDPAFIPDAIQTLTELCSSLLWVRSQSAKQCYHEFSFWLSKNSDEIDPRIERAKQTVFKGVIDLVFEEEDGWVIVDFKTDSYDEIHEDQFVAYYSPQVSAYVQEWEQLGYKVKEAGLYFTNRGKYVVV